MLSISLALGACSSGTDSPPAEAQGATLTVSGSVAYRERIALPAGSRVEIVLTDVSLADVAATEITRQSLVTEGQQVPIAFELQANRSDLRDGMRYAVHAEIRDPGERLMWTTDTVYPVVPATPGSTLDMGSLLLVRVAGEATSGNESDSLAGTQWTIVTIAGDSVGNDSRAALNFGPDGQLSGNTSCNAFSGSYSLTGEELTAGQMAVTMMACPEPLNELERRFLGILADTADISFNSEGLLVITGQNGESLIAKPTAETVELAGTNWTIRSIAGESVPEGARAALNFSADGMLTGSAGCNSLSGGYGLSGDRLTASQLAVTMMACPEPLMSLERKMLEILDGEAAVSINANGLLSVAAASGDAIVAEAAEAGTPRE